MIDFLRPRTAFRATDETDAGAFAAESSDHRAPPRAGRAEPINLGVAAHGKIGLLEHCGTGNLGDDATVEAVLQQIKARWPAASVVGLSLDPVDSEKRHGIPCVAIRQSVFPFRQEWASAAHPLKRGRYLDSLKARLKKTGPLFQVAKAIKNWMIVPPLRLAREIMFLVRSFSLARELDLLVICGGGQLLDWGGPWAFPYTLLKWNALAKCAGARCIFLNNGAGPLDARLSRWFVIRALAMADYVSTRDRSSAEFLRKVGFKGKISVVADSAWDLRLPDGLVCGKPASKSELVIGVAPMPYGDASRHHCDDATGYRHLIESLAEFCSELLRRGHRIRLFSSDIWFDSQALTDLDEAIHRNNPGLAPDLVAREPVADADGLAAALSRVDCFVTCRFHGVIFASLLNVPSIALAPHPKVSTLMEDMGLAKYCVDIATFNAADLTTKFDDLLANMDEVKARISRQVAQRQSLLKSQLDLLFRAQPESGAENQHMPEGRRVS
jgi:polysaccharide pyruvyl transferase WcaK-like protein